MKLLIKNHKNHTRKIMSVAFLKRNMLMINNLVQFIVILYAITEVLLITYLL